MTVPLRSTEKSIRTAQGRGLGCGLYPGRPFVDVDARARSVIWVDLGHRAYVADPATWLREHPGAERK